MRICLISPGHLSTNPRLVKEARAVSSAGNTTAVIVGRYQAWARQADLDLVDPRWHITYVPFGPHEAPRAKYLIQSGRRRIARAIVRTGFNLITATTTAQSPVSYGLIHAARAQPADLYIAHYVAALPAAARAAHRHGAAYAFDAEDFHLGDLPDAPEHAFEKRLIRTIEARYLPGAAYVTAASPGIADAYAAEYGIARPTVVLNAFPKGQAPDSPTPRGKVHPRPSLYWFSQTIGPNRGLECAVRAISVAKCAPHLHLRGSLAPGYEMALRTLAAEVGVGDRLHLHPPAQPQEMERLAAVYDVGLAAETGTTRNRQIALTNKQFTYLLAGVPVIMSDIPAHRAFASEAKGAAFVFATDDATSLATVLDALLSNPVRLAEARTRAYTLGQTRFNWEIERETFLLHIAGAMSVTSDRKSCANTVL